MQALMQQSREDLYVITVRDRHTAAKVSIDLAVN